MLRIEQWRQCWNNGKEMIIKLNIFHSTRPNIIIDEHELKTQIISTQAFFIILFVLLLVLAVSTSQMTVNTKVFVHWPSYDNYSLLYSHYPQSLSCLCMVTSVRYDQFVQLQVARFHQICQSVYVTTDWSLLIDYAHLRHDIFDDDFRYLGGRFFQTMSAFCDQSREIVTDELIKFNARRFITRNVMAHDLFQDQFQAYMKAFISSTKRSFDRSIQLVRELTQGNVLFSGVFSSTQLNIAVDSNHNVSLATHYIQFISNISNCSCQQASACVVPATIFHDRSYAPTQVTRFIVPGITHGCYVLEALLQSNLVCFYNQSCVNDLRQALNTTETFSRTILLNTTALDPSLASQFRIDSTFTDIIHELMVEEWINISSHENYYAACNPDACTYSVSDQNSLITVFSTAIGLLGSLTTILKIIVPFVVKNIRRYRKSRPNRIANEGDLATQTHISY